MIASDLIELEIRFTEGGFFRAENKSNFARANWMVVHLIIIMG